MADCLQFDCFGDLLFIVRRAGLPADFGLEQSVDQRGLAQTTLTCRHRKTTFIRELTHLSTDTKTINLIQNTVE